MRQYKIVIITAVISAVVALGVGFFGGMTYQKTKVGPYPLSGGNTRFAMNGQARTQGTNAAMIRPTVGEIISADATSMTVKLADGSTKIVLYSDSTIVNKAAQGSKEDLKSQEHVVVIGTTNPDGSITATSIQLGQMVRMGEMPSGPEGTNKMVPK